MPRCGATGRAVRITATILAVILTSLVAIDVWAPTASAACGNEALRAEQGAAGLALPECRAYELVSPGVNPLVSSSGDVNFGVRAASDGDAIAYFSYYPPQSGNSGFFYVSRRGEDGWRVEQASPQNTPAVTKNLSCEPEVDWSANLNRSVLGDGWEQRTEYPSAALCSRPEDELVAGEPVGFGNLYLRAAPGAAYQLVNAPGTAAPNNGQFEAASADFSHIVFAEEAELTPEAPAGYDLYEWDSGTLRLVSFLPDGTPVAGVLAGVSEKGESKAEYAHAVSANGESVLFTADGNLYLREHAAQPPSASGECSADEPDAACTIQIDESHGPGTSGGGIFQYANVEGTRVFFTDESDLTTDATAEAGRPDLYEYNVSSGLTDLTADTAEAANVRGFSGASEDGSYIYFVAKGVLTGTQKNAHGAAARAFEPNLYVEHEGALTFIATLEEEADSEDWQAAPTGEVANTGVLRARTSPDGRFIAFDSVNRLTGYNNTPAEPEDCRRPTGAEPTGPCSEIFLYEAGSRGLACVSCALDGSRPTAPTRLPAPVLSSERKSNYRPFNAVPAYLSRNVSETGEVFFTTADDLAGEEDENGVDDVYEYEDGAPRLISTGAASTPSTFYDASANGDDVFFVTSQSLLAGDSDNAPTLYDARVGGGYPQPPSPPSSCSGEQCRDLGSHAPTSPATNTATYVGPGNQTKTHGQRPGNKNSGKGRAAHRRKKLRHALKRCRRIHRHDRHKRRACKRRARKRYGKNSKHAHNHHGKAAHRPDKNKKHRGRDHTNMAPGKARRATGKRGLR